MVSHKNHLQEMRFSKKLWFLLC